MPKRWTGGGAKVRHKPTVVHKKGLAKKPPHPGGNPGSIQGVMMLRDKLPRGRR